MDQDKCDDVEIRIGGQIIKRVDHTKSLGLTIDAQLSWGKHNEEICKKVSSAIGAPGCVSHDPQRFMGKTVYVPHFDRDTVEFASRERDGSKPAINILLPFLKNITEESDLENFQDLILALDACYWLHKVISISLSRFGDDRRCDFSRF